MAERTRRPVDRPPEDRPRRDPTTGRPPRRRRWWPWAVLLIVVAALVAVAIVVTGDRPDENGSAVEPRFVEVVVADLVEITTLDGTLGRGEGEPITSPIGGIVTRVPEAGETVRQGELLYEVAGDPVFLMYGAVPAYRTLEESADTTVVVHRGPPGTLTRSAETASRLEQGDVVYAVDEEPTVLLYGDLPAYRTLREDVTGEDVRQLEMALVALGYDPDGTVTVDDEFTGYTGLMVERWQEEVGMEADGRVELGEVVFNPGPAEVRTVEADLGQTISDGRTVLTLTGSVAMEGDDVEQLQAGLIALGFGEAMAPGVFDGATREAVVAWQAAVGAEADGIVHLGEVVFLPGPVRVAAVHTAAGSSVGPGGLVLSATSSEIAVTAELPAADQGLLEVGEPVVVELPDGAEVDGTVTAVASVATRNQSGQTVFEVTVELDEPEVVGDLDEAPVEVDVITDSVEQVLTVPVTALIALAEGGYAVELDTGNGATRLVGVEVGFFADGRVEITADGIEPGDRVVVP